MPSPLTRQQQQIVGDCDQENQQGDSQGKSRSQSHSSRLMMIMSSSLYLSMWQSRFRQWKGWSEFSKAQLQVAVVLLIAYIGNNWKESYPRNDNHSYPMFWFMNGVFLLVAIFTMKHEPNTRVGSVQLLSRSQTEEWKGWMQWAFIMVRVVFVSFFLFSI
jgi:hypothetical protein